MNYEQTETKTQSISQDIKPFLSNIFILMSKYQSLLENIQFDLQNKYPKDELNTILIQTFYIITNDKPTMTLGDLYRFLKGKKIFFNISNLNQAFMTYDKDNDSVLSLVEFSNILNFNITQYKFIAKAEPNSNMIRRMINYLLKDFEFFEKLNESLKTLYSSFPHFSANDFFYQIASKKNDISLQDIERLLNEIELTNATKHAKYVYMKMSNNVLENIKLEQFLKYFTLISSKLNDNLSLLDSSSFLNSSQLTTMLNDAIVRTQEMNAPKRKKIEYDMFNTFIKFLLNKDTKLSSILANERTFNPATLYNYISNYKDIPLDTFINKLQTVFNVQTDKKVLSNIFERYCLRGYYITYIQFNKLIGAGVSNLDAKLAVDSYESMSKELKDKIELAIKTAVQNEIDIENFRKKLNKMNHFNLRKIFIDISQGNLYITTFDLQDYFELNKDQSNMLLKRFDKDDDGKISYDDVSILYITNIVCEGSFPLYLISISKHNFLTKNKINIIFTILIFIYNYYRS